MTEYPKPPPTITTRALTRSGRHTLAGDALAAKIVDCACKVMVEEGAARYSVRKVAQAAGVSIGHLQHYFPTKIDLQVAMLDSIGAQFYEYFANEIAPVEQPVDRLEAIARYVLANDEDLNHVALMREFWVLASRDEQVAASLSAFYANCREFAAQVLIEANESLDEAEAERRSRTAVSLLSGSFLYLDTTFGGEPEGDYREHLLRTIRLLPFIETDQPQAAGA
jgi:AcrR family transcriptional regulator